MVAFHVPWPRRAFGEPEQTPAAPLPPPNAFVRIGEDESVTVVIAHSEMGQGIWTGLAMLVADARSIREVLLFPQLRPEEGREEAEEEGEVDSGRETAPR